MMNATVLVVCVCVYICVCVYVCVLLCALYVRVCGHKKVVYVVHEAIAVF